MDSSKPALLSEPTALPSEPAPIRLAHGRTLRCGGEALAIAAPDGSIELELQLTAAGPLVKIRAQALELQADSALSLRCARFALEAEEGISLRCNGDLQTSVAGDIELRAAGQVEAAGRALRLRARRGEALLEASDDVRVEGERVLLNS